MCEVTKAYEDATVEDNAVEERVLGTLIKRNIIYGFDVQDALFYLEPKDFAHEVNADIFRAIRTLNAENKAINPINVTSKVIEICCPNKDIFEKLSNLPDCSTEKVFWEFIKLLKQKSAQRKNEEWNRQFEYLLMSIGGEIKELKEKGVK